jgi:D-3-phosphoglycerate dehydrogenase
MNDSRPKVVITDFDFGDIEIERVILEKVGARVIGLQAKSEAELFDEARECVAIMNQYARVGSATIAQMERCKVIARYGVGIDIVDVEAATRKGVLVTNVRDYCTEEVADHAIALWLTLARKLSDYDRATHQGVWQWQSGKPVHRLRGRTMGIVSFGKIGQAIALRAAAFGTELVAYDPFISTELAVRHNVELVSKEELLARSDYVLMQAPMTADTHHFLSDAEFAAMKPGAIVVNTGRGPTIDNKALFRALTQGHIAAAGLDDPEEEPAKKASWDPAQNPLFSLPNVLVTPHAAYYSEESIRAAREIAATQVAKVLSGQTPEFAVNAEALAAAN